MMHTLSVHILQLFFFLLNTYSIGQYIFFIIDSYNTMQLLIYAYGTTINGLKIMFSYLACCNSVIVDVQQN